MVYISEDYYEKLNKGKLEYGDVLIVKDGATTGKIGLFQQEYEKASINEHVFLLRCNKNISFKFLFYILRTPIFQKILAPYIQGIIGGINLSIKEIEIPLPPNIVQQQIVNEIEGYQKIIDGCRQVVDNYKTTIDIDPSWEMVELNNLYEANLDSRRVPITKGDRKAGKIPYYGASGIVDYVEGYLFDEDLLLISEDGANLKDRNYPIAFSISGKTWVNNHAHVLRFNDRISQKYVEFYFNQISLKPYLTGSAQPKLNQATLNSIKIPVPTRENMKRIVERIESENEIVEGNKKLSDIFTKKIQERIKKIWGN